MLGRSWKTSLAGIGLGLIPLGNQVLNMFSQGQHVDFVQVAMGAGIIALGILAKDRNVTGTENQK